MSSLTSLNNSTSIFSEISNYMVYPAAFGGALGSLGGFAVGMVHKYSMHAISGMAGLGGLIILASGDRSPQALKALSSTNQVVKAAEKQDRLLVIKATIVGGVIGSALGAIIGAIPAVIIISMRHLFSEASEL